MQVVYLIFMVHTDIKTGKPNGIPKCQEVTFDAHRAILHAININEQKSCSDSMTLSSKIEWHYVTMPEAS